MTERQERVAGGLLVSVVLLAGVALAAGINNTLFEAAPLRAGSFSSADVADLVLPEDTEVADEDEGEEPALEESTTTTTAAAVAGPSITSGATSTTVRRITVGTTTTVKPATTTVDGSTTTTTSSTTTTTEKARGRSDENRGRGGLPDD